MMRSTAGEAVGKVHTKIVATLGPASWAPESIRRLIEEGVDVFRLNFSHGTHQDHTRVWRDIREQSAAMDRPVAILQDLCGPKLRLGEIPGGLVDCVPGDSFSLVADRTSEDPRELTCALRELPDLMKPGQTVLLADGSVAMEVESTEPGRAHLKVVLGGHLRSNQGIHLPESPLNLSALSEKDLDDLSWGVDHEVDFVGLSFIRNAADVRRLREEMKARGLKSKIIGKIEKPEAVANLDEILEVTDGIMVARGDLGVELDVSRVPAVQKQVIAACHRARIPVITATQMLASMERANRPTRAEATDVFNAVLDGTDAVMLSGETAVGDFPFEAVRTMSQILTEAEAFLAGREVPPAPRGKSGWITPVTEAVVEAAALICRRLNPALVVVESISGRSAAAISKQRVTTPILAVSHDPAVVRQLCLHWGVTSLQGTGDGALGVAVSWASSRHMVKAGDQVVMIHGTKAGQRSQNQVSIVPLTAGDVG